MTQKIIHIMIVIASSLWSLLLALSTDFTSIPLVISWIFVKSMIFLAISNNYHKINIHESTWIKLVLIFKKIDALAPITYALYYQRVNSEKFALFIQKHFKF